MNPVRENLRRVVALGLAAVFCLLAVPAYVAVSNAYSTYERWGTLGPRPPPRINWCGRRYYPSRVTLSSAEMQAQLIGEPYAATLVTVARSPSGYEVLAAPMPPEVQASYHTSVCAMVVYLRVGTNSFRPYGLSGGP